MRKNSVRTLFILCYVGILINLVVLDWKVYKKELKGGTEQTPSVSFLRDESDQKNLLSPPTKEFQECPLTCLSRIYEATSSFKLPTPASQTKTVQTGSLIKEVFIPLGSGSTQKGDWGDIEMALASIDSSQYGKIKSVVFEAAVQIPNGNQGVYVRLFNATDKHPVWFSEMYHEGGTPKLLTSQPLVLDSGNKLYQVQMKTTLKDLAILNQSRIKITTE